MLAFAIGGGEILLLFCAAMFAFWIWMLVDCIENKRLGSTEKIVWVLAIIFLNWLGALIYFVTGRQKA